MARGGAAERQLERRRVGDLQLHVEPEDSVDFYEDETESVVTPNFALASGQSRLEALQAQVDERGEGFAIVDEDETPEVTTVVARSELEGLWWIGSIAGSTSLTCVVAEGTDLASVKESHDAVVQRRGKPSDRLLMPVG